MVHAGAKEQTEATVEMVFPHPSYESISHDYDIALLKLKEPLNFSGETGQSRQPHIAKGSLPPGQEREKFEAESHRNEECELQIMGELFSAQLYITKIVSWKNNYVKRKFLSSDCIRCVMVQLI